MRVDATFHRLDLIAGRKLMLEHGDLVPLRVSTFAFRYPQQVSQATVRLAVLLCERRAPHWTVGALQQWACLTPRSLARLRILENIALFLCIR